MWRQLARDVKISLELLNVHLCFAIGYNIYDYGGVKQYSRFVSFYCYIPHCTVKRDSRAKVIISRK